MDLYLAVDKNSLNAKNKTLSRKYLNLKFSIIINVINNLVIVFISFNPIVCITLENENVANGFKYLFKNICKLAKN